MKPILVASAMILVMVGCSDGSMNPTRSASVSRVGAAATDARLDPELGHGGVLLTATLTGAAEVPGPGDPDGSGTVRLTLNRGQAEVCFALEVTNIAPATAAHIHV